MKGKQNAYSLQQNKKFVLDKGYSLSKENDRIYLFIRKGDEKYMCSSFERLLIKENEQGEVRGRAQAVIELLEEIGEPSEALKNHIMEQQY